MVFITLPLYRVCARISCLFAAKKEEVCKKSGAPTYADMRMRFKTRPPKETCAPVPRADARTSARTRAAHPSFARRRRTQYPAASKRPTHPAPAGGVSVLLAQAPHPSPAAGGRTAQKAGARTGARLFVHYFRIKGPNARRAQTVYFSSSAGALSSSALFASYPFLPSSAKVACLPASTPGWL